MDSEQRQTAKHQHDEIPRLLIMRSMPRACVSQTLKMSWSVLGPQLAGSAGCWLPPGNQSKPLSDGLCIPSCFFLARQVHLKFLGDERS